ncbi:MAG: O-antigen ligase family protein [Verrucomicrobia bacterium]|nr:O-antigen ligase family protein [Verrucomicrobiota bacterium]
MIEPSNAKRPSTWEWTQTLLLVANLAWTTLCLGGYRPETMVVTATLTGALVSVHLLRRVMRGSREVHPAGWWLLPFLLYAAANVLWVTPVKWLGWREWFGWMQMAAVFWVVLDGVRAPATRRVVIIGLAVTAAVAVLLGCYQRFVQPDWLMLGRVQAEQFFGRASGPFGIPNSLAALLLLLLPAAAELAWRKTASRTARRFAAALAILYAFGLVLTVSRGAWIGLALVAMVWPLVAGAGNWSRRFALAGIAGAAVIAVVGGLWSVSPLVRQRLTQLVQDAGETTRPIMWRASWRLFREHPAVGSGAASYNVLFEKHRPERFFSEPQWTHNDYLNTLGDYGAVGFVLCFGAMAAIGARCWWRRGNDPAGAVPAASGSTDDFAAASFHAALAAGLAAFGLQLFVDFHFKIPALALSFAVVSALVVRERWPVATRGRVGTWPALRRVVCVGGAIGCMAAVLAWVVPMYRAEALRYRAHQGIDRLALERANAAGYRRVLSWVRADLVDAVELDPRNAHAWADLAYAISLATSAEPERLADRAWLAELGRDAEAAANQALALTPAVGEFFIRRGVARDLQGRWLEAGDDFSTAVGLNPTHALTWYYHAYHHSLDRRGRGMAEASLAFCLRLDPNNPEGLALRQLLAISAKAP